MPHHKALVLRARVLLCKWAAGSGLLFAAAFAAVGQDQQVAYDSSGNLTSEISATAVPPVILAQPQQQIVPASSVGSFFVVAADTRGLSYQWRFFGTNVSGATGDAFMLTNVSSLNEGPYSVVLANSSGSVTSAPAMLWFDGDGDGLPDSWELAYFGNLTNTAVGDFDHDGVSNLQEFLDGTNPTNSSSALYRLTLMSDGGVVTASPFKPAYTNGDLVTLLATPNVPESFRGWTGDLVARTNSVTLLMNANKTVFAHFQPFSITWTNLADGIWDAPTNWNPNLVPIAGDDVSIAQIATVTVDQPAVCHDFTFTNGATLNISSTLALEGNASWPGGTLTGPGTLTLQGNTTWSAGNMTGIGVTVVASNATLSITGNGGTLDARTLENAGTISWNGSGILGLNNGAIFTNRPGALFAAQNALQVGGTAGRFDNAGTFRQSTPTVLIGFGFTFTNYGLVDIQTGTFTFNAGGVNSGAMNIASGAMLNIAGNTFISSFSGSIAGDGQLLVGGFATANLAGLVNVNGTNTFSSTANLTGNYIATNNTIAIAGGLANFSGTGIVNPAVLTMTSGTLSGNQTVTIGSVMTWSGGNMIGVGRTVIPPGVTLSIPGAGVGLDARTLENQGTALCTAGSGSIGLSSGAVITNGAAALFHMQGATTISAAPGRFDNAGTFRKSVSTGAGSIGTLNNYGLADIQTGSLTLGSGTNAGNINLAAGTALTISGGTFNSGPSGSIAGPAQLTVSGFATANLAGLVNVSGTNIFNSTANLTGIYIATNNTISIAGGLANFSGTGIVNPAVLTITSGTLSGNQTVTIGNAMTWSGGNMIGVGRTVIPSGAALNIPGAGVGLDARTLENQGTVLYTAGSGSLGLSSGAVITNGTTALFEMQGATTISSGPGRFDNAGTFRKSVSTGTSTIGVLNNYGTVDLRTGILVASGSYSAFPTSTLNCVLGGNTPGTGYSQLQASGTAGINGSLTVALTPGFAPSSNNSFALVSAGTRSGVFTSFLYPSNLVTMQLSNTPTSVLVRATDYTTNGPPIIVSDFPALQVFYAGRSMTLAATVAGGKPATYQWQLNSTNLSDGGRITGSQSSVLAITNLNFADSGNFQLFVTNSQGTATSAVAPVLIEAVPKLNAGGAGWTLRGTTVPVMNSNNVTLTSGLGSTARTVFYNAPLYIRDFTTSFIYSDTSVNGANGVAFCLQNDPQGASALGYGGGGLGYYAITSSAALLFNIYSPLTVGIAFGTNGTVPDNYMPTSPVNMASGNPVFVSLVYTGGVLKTTLIESNTAHTFTTNIVANLSAIVGADTAYVGLTGADGGVASTQVISNFTFVPLPTISVGAAPANTLLLSWPASIGGYTAQAKSNLTATAETWRVLTNAPNQVSGKNQITLPLLPGSQYYQLSIRPTD
jgi:hypothetical protein